jgi:hypothetical protein
MGEKTKMYRFANIFELPESQVLITLLYNSDEDEFELTQTAFYKDVMGQVKASFEDEDKAKAAFSRYKLKDAEKFYNTILNMFQ